MLSNEVQLDIWGGRRARAFLFVRTEYVLSTRRLMVSHHQNYLQVQQPAVLPAVMLM